MALDTSKLAEIVDEQKHESEKTDSGKVKLSKEEKIAKLEAKKKKLASQIKQLQARDIAKERKADARKKIIVGGLVLNMMKTDDSLKAKIEAALASSLKKDADKELFNM